MSDDFVLLGLLFILLLLWAQQQRKKRRRAWEGLIRRVYTLETEVSRFKSLSSRLDALEQHILASLSSSPAPAVPLPNSPPVSTQVTRVPQAASMPPAPESPKSQVQPKELANLEGVPGAGASPYRIFSIPQAANAGKDLSGLVKAREVATTPTVSPALPQQSAIREWFKKAVNYEEVVGGNLFTKLGIILLVLGFGLFVATQWHRLGPGLRILIGYFVSGLMLVPGTIYERREKWRILARAGIGGGWALLYFVTYALHHVVVPPLISSEAIDLVLMFIVVAGMVIHTLKYRSQVVTGLAFLLAFTTVTISHVSVYSLSAAALLAFALVVVVLRDGWYELEIFGILGAYANHYIWVRPIIARVGMHHAFAGYFASCALLMFYWLIFNASYVVRRIKDQRQENLSTTALLMNVGLFLGLMSYQAVYPTHTFQFFLMVGAVELGLGQLKITRRRRNAFALLTTVGAVLVVAAFPYKFSGSQLSVLWLAEGEAFFLAGVFAHEIIFRRLGLLALGLTACQMLVGDAAKVAEVRWESGLFKPEPHLALVFGFSMMILYATAHWVPRRWSDRIKSEFELWSLRGFSYLAGTLALVEVWLAAPPAWMSPLWVALALALLLAARRWRIAQLPHQAHAIVVVAYIHVFVVNFPLAPPHEHHLLRVISVAVTAALLYAGSRWVAITEGAQSTRICAAYSAAATSLVALVSGYELKPVYAGPAWVGWALILMFLGSRLTRQDLQLEADFLSAAALVSLLTVNLGLGSLGHFNRVQFLTICSSAFAFYLLSRWRRRPGSSRMAWIPNAYTWSASTLLALLEWRELEPVAVAVAWVILGLILLEFGLPRSSLSLQYQAFGLFTAGFVRLFFSNLSVEGMSGILNPRVYTTIPVACTYLYTWRRLKNWPADHLWRKRWPWVEDYFGYLGVAAIAALLRFEAPEMWVAAGWAALAAVLLFTACIFEKSVFLTQGLLLGLATLYRAVLFNLYHRSYLSTSPWQSRPFSVGATAALMLLALVPAFRLRMKGEAGLSVPKTWVHRAFNYCWRRPEQFFFFAPVVLITIILLLDLHSGFVTLAWGAEAVAIIGFALVVGERSYRLGGLVLLLLCIGKVIIVDLPRLWGTSYFYMTLIGLGASLVLVSYLYTRHREKFRQFL